MRNAKNTLPGGCRLLWTLLPGIVLLRAWIRKIANRKLYRVQSLYSESE